MISTMFQNCPICRNNKIKPLLDCGSSPLCLFDKIRWSQKNYFKKLEIFFCNKCGHIFNKSCVDLTNYYKNDLLNANLSANLSMNYKRFKDIVKLIGVNRLYKSKILDIGAGCGALALYLTKYAKKVTICEPNKNILGNDLLSKKIVIINDFFDKTFVTEKFDIVIVKQVLEHVPDPITFMGIIKDVLSSDGIIYLEVPNVDFVLQNVYFCSFYHPHQHYFSPSTISMLCNKIGLSILSFEYITGGNDMALILSKSDIKSIACHNQKKYNLNKMKNRFNNKIYKCNYNIKKIKPPIFLYCANWTTSSFCNFIHSNSMFDGVLDDFVKTGSFLISSNFGNLPIFNVNDIDITKNISSIIIPSLLHYESIANRLRNELNFSGKIYSFNI